MHVLYQAMFGPLQGLRDVVAPLGGSQGLDWTHVRDTSQGVVRLLRAPADVARGQAFNISCGVSTPHLDILTQVTEIVGHDSGMRIGNGNFFERGAPLEITKARDLLGFTPRFADMREGLRDYHDWLKSVGDA
jgi:nucleoside-diphosphate-sugar epimerase